MKVNITPSPKTEWLVIFLVLDTNEFDGYLGVFFDGLKKIKLRDKTKVFLLKDTVHRMKNPGNFIPFELEVSEFVYNKADNETLPVKRDLTEVDERDGLAWRKAIEQIYTETNAEFNSLITWTHGSGLSIANQFPPHEVSERKVNLIRNFKERRNRKTPDFKSEKFSCNKIEVFDNVISIEREVASVDCLNLQQLFISEIGEGLESTMQKKKFDIVIMCNCRSQVLDNCYNLRKITRFYFAPMEAVQLDGYGFPNFIDFINRTAGADMGEQSGFIKRVVINNRYFRRFFYKKYFKTLIKELFDGYKELIPERTYRSEVLIATDLSDIGEIVLLLNPISRYFLTNRTSVYPILLNSLKNNIGPLPGSVLYDAINVFKHMKDKLSSAEFNLYVDRFVTFVNSKVLVDRMVGEDLINRALPVEPTCFTVWLPTSISSDMTESFVCQELRGYLRSSFVTDTEWDDFVSDFISWQGQQ
jgi:hypothetical protein